MKLIFLVGLLTAQLAFAKSDCGSAALPNQDSQSRTYGGPSPRRDRIEFPMNYGLRFAAQFGPEKAPFEPKRDYPFGKQLVTIGSYLKGIHVGLVGVATRHYVDKYGNTVYVAFDKQPVELVEVNRATGQMKPLEGQGLTQHPSGFSTPVGTPKGFKRPIEHYTKTELAEHENIREGQTVKLEYPSGVIVTGKLAKVQTDSEGFVAVLKFEANTATVTYGDHTLFKPGWGEYDLLVGSTVTNSQAVQ
ncbi:MAG TPA: hypothetical protein VFV50_05555 [Bdellovibrionales bacterium]|nr:hypothetical protein [Bdellovibrionales bacterium]